MVDANLSEDAPGRPSFARAGGVIWLLGLVLCGGAAGIFWLAILALKARHAGLDAFIVASMIYAASIVAITLGLWRLQAKLYPCSLSTAARRYRRRQITAVSVYAVLLIAALWVHPRLDAMGVLGYAAAVIPALPLVATVAALGLYLREETDEFERAIMVEAALWATGGVLTMSTMWGFTEMLAAAPHAPSWIWFPVWSGLLGLANVLTRKRYQ